MVPQALWSNVFRVKLSGARVQDFCGVVVTRPLSLVISNDVFLSVENPTPSKSSNNYD